MYIENPLIEWYIHRSHRPIQRQRRPGMIQPTRLVHHMLVERRRDLVRLAIVYRPHRPNHRPEPKKLHRRREVDHLVRTLFVTDSRMTRREIRKFGVLHVAADDPLNRGVHRVERTQTRTAVSDRGYHDTQGASIRSCQALRRP